MLTVFRILHFGACLAVHTALRAYVGVAQRRQYRHHGHVWTVRQESHNGCSAQLHIGTRFTTNGQSYYATETEGRPNVLHAGHAWRIH